MCSKKEGVEKEKKKGRVGPLISEDPAESITLGRFCHFCRQIRGSERESESHYSLSPSYYILSMSIILPICYSFIDTKTIHRIITRTMLS